MTTNNKSLFKNDSEIYVISSNNNPYCYCKNMEEAQKVMWSIARDQKIFQNCYNGYNSYIKEYEDLNYLELVGYNKFSIVNVEKVLYRYRIRCIKEINEYITRRTVETHSESESDSDEISNSEENEYNKVDNLKDKINQEIKRLSTD